MSRLGWGHVMRWRGAAREMAGEGLETARGISRAAKGISREPGCHVASFRTRDASSRRKIASFEEQGRELRKEEDDLQIEGRELRNKSNGIGTRSREIGEAARALRGV